MHDEISRKQHEPADIPIPAALSALDILSRFLLHTIHGHNYFPFGSDVQLAQELR
jgi:hypothetical protein